MATEFARALESPGLWPLLPCLTAALLPRFARYYDQLLHLPRRTRRALQRRWKRSLAALALLLALGQAPALAATINVNTNIPDVFADGQCSLIEAIENANDNTTGNVHSDCTAGTPNGADTINLSTNSTHTLTAVPNSTLGATGLPVISSTLTIEGMAARFNARAPRPPSASSPWTARGT